MVIDLHIAFVFDCFVFVAKANSTRLQKKQKKISYHFWWCQSFPFIIELWNDAKWPGVCLRAEKHISFTFPFVSINSERKNEPYKIVETSSHTHFAHAHIGFAFCVELYTRALMRAQNHKFMVHYYRSIVNIRVNWKIFVSNLDCLFLNSSHVYNTKYTRENAISILLIVKICSRFLPSAVFWLLYGRVEIYLVMDDRGRRVPYTWWCCLPLFCFGTYQIMNNKYWMVYLLAIHLMTMAFHVHFIRYSNESNSYLNMQSLLSICWMVIFIQFITLILNKVIECVCV